MKTVRRPTCAVFSEREVEEIRKIPGLMKWILLLFIAIVVLIFVPFQTVTKLSEQVGAMTSQAATFTVMLEEKRQIALRNQQRQSQRMKKIEEQHLSFQKKFYWINRNSREANRGIQELNKSLKPLCQARSAP